MPGDGPLTEAEAEELASEGFGGMEDEPTAEALEDDAGEGGLD